MSEKPKTFGKRDSHQEINVKGGGIHAGRDVIMGDQYNVQDQRVAHINSPAEFISELEKLQAQIAALKQQSDLDPMDIQTIEVAEGRVNQAAEEANKPEPLGSKINSALEKAKKTTELLSGSIQSAVDLGKSISNLAGMAINLFGG